jgi:cyclopropane fatty-acyl-phospholipid synthase-like methyltransferase
MDWDKKEYQENLDFYSKEYCYPNAARTFDQRAMSILVARLLPLVEGPSVLEMGHGDGLWTGRLIEKFGNSHLVDASLELINHAKSMHGNKLLLRGIQSYPAV